MKKWLTACLCGAMALPISASELQIIKQIEPLLLNGKELTGNDFKAEQVLNLQPGQNQLLFALDQVVAQDGRQAKLVFPPVVIRFDAQPSPVTLSYATFRDANQAKKFRRNLDFSLVDQQGQAVDYQVDLLPIGGFSQFEDYQAAMAEYNLSDGEAVLAARNSLQDKPQAKAVSSVELVDRTEMTSEVKATLQQDFLTMSVTERQEFISWAVKHLND